MVAWSFSSLLLVFVLHFGCSLLFLAYVACSFHCLHLLFVHFRCSLLLFVLLTYIICFYCLLHLFLLLVLIVHFDCLFQQDLVCCCCYCLLPNNDVINFPPPLFSFALCKFGRSFKLQSQVQPLSSFFNINFFQGMFFLGCLFFIYVFCMLIMSSYLLCAGFFFHTSCQFFSHMIVHRSGQQTLFYTI